MLARGCRASSAAAVIARLDLWKFRIEAHGEDLIAARGAGCPGALQAFDRQAGVSGGHRGGDEHRDCQAPRTSSHASIRWLAGPNAPRWGIGTNNIFGRNEDARKWFDGSNCYRCHLRVCRRLRDKAGVELPASSSLARLEAA